MDTSGLQAPIVRSAPWIAGNDAMAPYVLSFSPDGRKMIRSGHGIPSAFRIYDFDRCTGTISNPTDLTIPDEEAYASWGCFSPNSRYLYVLNLRTRLYQYDTWASDISASAQLVGVYDGFKAEYNTASTFFMMTMGPDQRIYMSSANGCRYLNVIHQPDEPGLACDFRQHDFVLPATFPFFLPNMPFYRLYNLQDGICDTLQIQRPVVAQWRYESDTSSNPLAFAFKDISYYQPTYWHWSFGDGDTSLLESPVHVFPSAGTYQVCLRVCNLTGQCDTFCRSIEVKSVSTSAAVQETLQVYVWPNPASQQIWVAHETLFEGTFVLTDLAGRVVRSQALAGSSGIERIELRGLPAGMYFWALRDGARMRGGKLVVRRE